MPVPAIIEEPPNEMDPLSRHIEEYKGVMLDMLSSIEEEEASEYFKKRDSGSDSYMEEDSSEDEYEAAWKVDQFGNKIPDKEEGK